MRQTQLGLTLVFLLVMCGIAWAGKEAYRVVISQDKELCTTMLKLINDDLREHGEIRYEDHEIFAVIKWEPLKNVAKNATDITGVPTLISNLDLNNDGRPEIVLKFSGYFKDRLLDWLEFFEGDLATFSSYNDFEIDKNRIGRFPEEGSPPLATYILRTPVPLKDRTKDRLGRTFMPEGVGGWIVINPFIYKSTAYLVITDRGVDGTSSSGEGVVIDKYKAPKELDEVCYFKQIAPEKKKRR